MHYIHKHMYFVFSIIAFFCFYFFEIQGVLKWKKPKFTVPFEKSHNIRAICFATSLLKASGFKLQNTYLCNGLSYSLVKKNYIVLTTQLEWLMNEIDWCSSLWGRMQGKWERKRERDMWKRHRKCERDTCWSRWNFLSI